MAKSLLTIFFVLICLGYSCTSQHQATAHAQKLHQSNHVQTQHQLDSLVQKLATTYKCRVTTKVVDDHAGVYYAGYDARMNKKVTDFSGTVDIGSCTKMFTASAIMQLVEQGRLSLDSRFSTILPNPEGYHNLLVIDGQDYIDSVTIRQLLNHTSGIPDYFGTDDDVEFAKYGDSSLHFTHRQILELAKKANKPYGKPGELFYYSNTNYMLLGEIIRKVTGKDFKRYFHQHILNPLNLEHTWFFSGEQPPVRAMGHYKGKESFMPAGLAGAAGEIIATLDDMQHFIDAWNKGLLFRKKNTIDIMKTQDFHDMVPGIKYGLGTINLIDMVMGHAGQTFGFQSFIGVTKNGASFAIALDDAVAPAWDGALAIGNILSR